MLPLAILQKIAVETSQPAPSGHFFCDSVNSTAMLLRLLLRYISMFPRGCVQGQDRSRALSELRSLSYSPGGGGTGDLQGALREARTNQFTTSDGARLGVTNVALILTTARSNLSTQVALFSFDMRPFQGPRVKCRLTPSVCPTFVPCLRFSRNRKAVETSSFVKT